MTHKYERKFRLWPTSAKPTDRHPDLSGDIILAGKAYWLNAWRNDDGSISGSVGKPKAPPEDREQTVREASGAPLDIDDEIPF